MPRLLWLGSLVASVRGAAPTGLARLAAKFGPEITLAELTARFSYDCLWRAQARSKRGASSCGVYLPDLAQPRPPDLRPALRLRLVKDGWVWYKYKNCAG